MATLRDLHPTNQCVVPGRLLAVSFARSSGPGGQHVNKVETKVDLRLDLDGCVPVLGATVVERVRRKLATRLDGDGNLHVTCSEYREQARNIESALQKMEVLLQRAMARPKPRRPTQPTAASRERRLATKKWRGQIKRWRSGHRSTDSG